MGAQRPRLWAGILGVLGVLGIVIGANLFADARLAGVHADLTQGQIYTLSAGTRKILAGLHEPITLRLYYSRQLGAAVPDYGSYADRVREMLRQYAAASHGRIRLRFLDPVPFSRIEDRALADGLQGAPLNAGGTKVYFGLVGTNLLDQRHVIPFFHLDRARFLQYDLTRLVYALSQPRRPVVGVMSPLPWNGNPMMMLEALRHGQNASNVGRPYALAALLRQTGKVVSVPLTARMIPRDVRVLLLIDPRDLSLPTQYAIDQFVMHGGRLLAMVDPWSDTLAALPTRSGMPRTETGSDLGRLFKAWGIAFDPNEVVGDLGAALQVQASQGGATPYVAWFTIRHGIDRNDPAIAALREVTVATPGALAKAPGAKIRFIPLLTSGPQSGLVPVAAVKHPDPAQVLANFKPAGGPRVIAARIEGVLHSAFAAPPPLPKGQSWPTGMPAYQATTGGAADMVVVADSDLAADTFWISEQNFFGQPEAIPFSDNGPFIANLVDSLSGSNALLGLRARGVASRPFTVIDQMQATAQAQFRATELALERHLTAVQQRLSALRNGAPAGSGKAVAPILTPAQHHEIVAAEADIAATRARLRQVQYDLNRHIAALQLRLVLLNLAAVPVVVVLAAGGLGLWRRRRRQRDRARREQPA